jgi:hypothetical protein
MAGDTSHAERSYPLPWLHYGRVALRVHPRNWARESRGFGPAGKSTPDNLAGDSYSGELGGFQSLCLPTEGKRKPPGGGWLSRS